MALERSNIVRSDFPTVRRGLDPEAVQKHLAAIADEAERLRAELASAQAAASAAGAAPQTDPSTVASQAGRRVEAIVAAAEASAGEIERAARQDAERTRAQAVEERRARAQELTVGAAGLRTRLDELDRALSALTERIGEVAPRPSTPAPAGEPRAASPAPATAASPVEAAAPVAARPGEDGSPGGADAPPGFAAPAGGAAPSDGAPPAEVAPPAATAPPEAPPAGLTADIEGARLVLLNLALSGSTRDEADRYVAQHFNVPDRRALLDEVFASVAE